MQSFAKPFCSFFRSNKSPSLACFRIRYRQSHSSTRNGLRISAVNMEFPSAPSAFSFEVGYTIAEQAATFGVDRLILGATQRTLVEKALRGDVLRTVSELLPE